jgi:hypothetical protein
VKYCVDCVQQYCIDVNSFPFGNSFQNKPNTTNFFSFFQAIPSIFCYFPSFVNHLSVAKRRSLRRAAHSKATRSEPDDDHSCTDPANEELVRTEISSEGSNYSEDESSEEESVEEESEEEEKDADEENTDFNEKGNLSTPVSRKGPGLSDYDTPIADLLRHNRSRQPERNVTKRVPKSSQRKRRGRHDKKRNTDAPFNDNNEGALFNCCCFDHMLFCFLYRNFCNHYFNISVFFYLFLVYRI